MKHTIRNVVALTLLGMTVGCVTTEPTVITRTVEVKVPVPVPFPEPPVVERPVLKISELTPADYSNPGKVVQMYQATIQQLIGYSNQLETILDGYRKPKADHENK